MNSYILHFFLFPSKKRANTEKLERSGKGGCLRGEMNLRYGSLGAKWQRYRVIEWNFLTIEL